MPRENAFVSRIDGFDPPLDRPATELMREKRALGVKLADGTRGALDPGDPRSAKVAAVLQSLQKQRIPVYIEVDPASSFITTVHIPLVSRVVEVTPAEGGINVQLEQSHARHVLRRDDPNFAEIERRLGDAVRGGDIVFVTENDAHQIIDVRAYMPDPEGPDLPFPKPKPGDGWPPYPRPKWYRVLFKFWWWKWWPGWWWYWWLGCVSQTKAQEIFDAMALSSCEPTTVPPPCIPFLYPDDGCWGRAHEMARLMIAVGVKPKKVWIRGNLHTPTKNNPQCYVNWGWHVAPTLCVRGPKFAAQSMVIDPSLFATPVSKATWKDVQGDPNATLTDKSADVFYLWANGQEDYDPNYTQTNNVLATYRSQLQLRSAQYGPPPYANCP